jgi:hypothetical protein
MSLIIPGSGATFEVPGLYTTAFPLTQNPLNERGWWLTGQANGVSWSDLQTNGSYVYATRAQGKNFYDSIACLTGTGWTPSQQITGLARTVNKVSGTNGANEIELHLRRTISATVVTGYECTFSVRPNDGTQYIELVRWDGTLGSFTVATTSVVGPSVQDGDTVFASIQGTIVRIAVNGVNQITADVSSVFNGGVQYINGVSQGAVGSASPVWLTGTPGMGVDYGGLSTDLITDQGFYSLVARNF